MTSKEWLEEIINHPEWSICNIEWDVIDDIKRSLEVLDKLKYPYEEEETEEYLRQSHWYWNEYLGELCCGTTIYKWTGNCKEINNKLNIPFKSKEWIEVYHTGTASAPVSLKQYFRHKEVLE